MRSQSEATFTSRGSVLSDKVDDLFKLGAAEAGVKERPCRMQHQQEAKQALVTMIFATLSLEAE